jgi:hypothetical protein
MTKNFILGKVYSFRNKLAIRVSLAWVLAPK